jgi:hypothetical protein
MDTNTRQNLRQRMDELRTLRDEIRVELNLAGMDLRDEWRELEKRLPDPGRLAREIKGVTAEMVDEFLEEAHRFRKRLGARP